MKTIKIFIGLAMLAFTACQSKPVNQTDANAKSIGRPVLLERQLLPSSGKSSFKGKIGEKQFVAAHEVFASKNANGNYYEVYASANECDVTLLIPINKGIGSFSCEGSFTDKLDNNKVYKADAAAVTLEENTADHLSGSFTLLAADSDGNIKSVNEGRFKALIQ